MVVCTEGLNVPLVTLYVISWMILQATQPGKQHHSTTMGQTDI